jgi:8-oxo-dGTP diphosphatase
MAGDRKRSIAGLVVPDGVIHVVAGVLLDARGRVLLARRTAGRDLAGAWEFPGGKVDPGETALQALDRELHEELGIRIDGAEPLIAVPQAYPSKRIVLDVYRVSNFTGKPRGLEKQALAWSPPGKLPTYPMPPADRPVVAALTQPVLYLVTPDIGDSDDDTFLRHLEAALAGGVGRVQLRVPSAGEARRRALAVAAKALCDRHGAQLLVNADVEFARAAGCGVHLPATMLMALDARPLPPDAWIGASCHDPVQLARAQAIGADFAVLGPVCATVSHPGQPSLGWRRFAELREHVSLPMA